MKVRILLLTIVFAAGCLAIATTCGGGEVKVMVAIGLSDTGEDCKLLSVADFRRHKGDYEEFQELLKNAVTLKKMAENGWIIAYVRPEDDYHLIILER